MAKQQPEADDRDEGGGLQGFAETMRRLLKVSKDDVKAEEERERDKRRSA